MPMYVLWYKGRGKDLYILGDYFIKNLNMMIKEGNINESKKKYIIE